MIILEVHHHKVYIRNSDHISLGIVKRSLTVFKRNFFTSKENPKKWEVIKLFNQKDYSFPVGALEDIVKSFKRKKLDFQVQDLRTYPKPYLPLKLKNELPELWENQTKALSEILKHPSGIIMSPPGTGKSRIILETLLEKRVKTLIIVPNKSIQNKMYHEFSAALGFMNVSTKAPAAPEDEEDVEEEESKEAEKHKTKTWGSSYLEKDEEEEEDEGSKKVKTWGSSYLDKDEDEEEDEEPKKTRTWGSSYLDKDESLTNEEKYLKSKGYDYKNRGWNKSNAFNKNSFKNKYGQKKKKTNPKRNVKDNVNVTILCFHSLSATDPEWLKSIEAVLIDECHHASATSIRIPMLIMENAAYRYFYSATPWRDLPEDMKILVATIGKKKLFELSGHSAVEAGLIAKPIMRVISPPSPSRYLGDYKKRREVIDYCIIGNDERNKCIIKQAIELYEDGHNVMISVDEVFHLEILETMFQDLFRRKPKRYQGAKVITIKGEDKDVEKFANIEKVAGTLEPIITIATMAVGEGTDMPNLTACILAAGGVSSTRYLQRITRPSRRILKNMHKKKDKFIIVDFDDWFNPKLKEQFNKRQKTFRKYFEGVK